MKISKKQVSGWGFKPGTKIVLAIVTPPSVAIFYTKQGSDTYEFICMKTWVTGATNSYFLMYEFVSGGAMCGLFGGTSHINAAYHYCPDQLGCVWLHRPIRVCSAAPIS